VIQRYDGHIAQYLGDGLLVYFGYPLAHEDDAQRAVRAGLAMVEAIGPLNTRLARERGVQLAVRLGIHTGLVVVGEVGGGSRQERLALGETPYLAARLQGLAEPDTVVVSTVTYRAGCSKRRSSSRCCVSSKTCTGSIPPPWNCSASSSTRARPPGS
jgi:class 3 adenylate cyclase